MRCRIKKWGSVGGFGKEQRLEVLWTGLNPGSATRQRHIPWASHLAFWNLSFLIYEIGVVCQLFRLSGVRCDFWETPVMCQVPRNSPGFTEKCRFLMQEGERNGSRGLAGLWQGLFIWWRGHSDFPGWWPSWRRRDLAATPDGVGPCPVVIASGTFFLTHSPCSLSLLFWCCILGLIRFQVHLLMTEVKLF